MNFRDHYAILGIAPSASKEEIKKAYRLLALQYHPDKTGGDPYAAVQFEAIKEAYEVLTNPRKKELYLQQRWYRQSTGNKKSDPVVTPVSLLKRVLELDRYVSKLDTHRMDKQGLSDHLHALLSDENIATINRFDEPGVNKEIVVYSMRIARFLTAGQADSFLDKWEAISKEPQLTASVREYLSKKRASQSWEKYKPAVIAVVVMLLCFLIYFLSK